jgi:hypothetical protein
MVYRTHPAEAAKLGPMSHAGTQVPDGRTTVLPWQKRQVANRNRRTAINRERDAMAGALEAELVVRQGSVLTATQRSILHTYIGVAMLLSHLDRRLLRGQHVDAGTYQKLASNLVQLSARLGVEKTGTKKLAEAKPDAAGVVSLSEYLSSKGADQ